MKKTMSLSLWRLTVIALALLIFQGCDPNGVERDLGNTSDTGYEGFQSDVELYYEFVYRKESLLLNYLNYITDGFTKELFKGEISNEEYDKFFHELAMLNADSPKYKAAIQRLESSGVLQSPTRTRGLFGTGMFSWMSGSAKRARNRVLTVASNLSPEERSKLYNQLQPEYKRYSSSEEQFWRQLKDGTYDNQAAQIHKDFVLNYNTEYPSLAKEKGLERYDIVKAEGAAGIKAGVEDMIDTSAKFIPGIDTGANLVKITDNIDKINKGKDLYEKATNALELLETLEDMAGGDSGLLGEILDELNPVPTKYDVAKSLATKMDHYLKSDIKPGDKEETFGKVTVIDKNREKPTQYVIVQKKEGTPTDDNTPSIYITGKEYMQKGIDLLVKAGKWLVTAIGENGRRETVEIEVKPGKVTITEVNTAEPEEKDEEEAEDPDAGNDVFYVKASNHDGKSKIFLTVELLPNTSSKVWADWNGNGKKDKGEEIQDFSYLNYHQMSLQGIPTVQTVKIHGASFVTKMLLSVDYKRDYEDLRLSLDVRQCKALKGLYVKAELPVTSLQADGCTALDSLICTHSKLTSLNLTGCKSLEYLKIDYNELTSLNLTGCKSLKEILCWENKLTTLDASECTALEYLNCRYNELTSLNVSKCTALEHLDCAYNELTSLNASGCKALEYIECTNNKLTYLDATGCTLLWSLKCRNNGLLGVIPPSFESLSVFDHDIRYEYDTYWDDKLKKAVYLLKKDTQRGWWYDHEPEGGCHYPEPCNK